jgi:hypothetical protein
MTPQPVSRPNGRTAVACRDGHCLPILGLLALSPVLTGEANWRDATALSALVVAPALAFLYLFVREPVFRMVKWLRSRL